VKGVVLCEYSGRISGALRARGIECYSCDILPTEGDPTWHFQEDAVSVAYDMPWDFAIMHPDCTKLANSGAKHLYNGGQKANGPYFPRWEEMEEGAHFYQTLRDAPIKFKAVENPVMHGAAIKATKRGKTYFNHPHHFGDPFFKLTGFELIGFPPLRRTHYMNVPKPGTDEHRKWSKCHRMAPGGQRGLERARFEPGFAAAIAAQWGAFLLGEYDL
jgi:hypothetical protein